MIFIIISTTFGKKTLIVPCTRLLRISFSGHSIVQTSSMQNSYQIYCVRRNPFLVGVPPEKETDFTITHQKVYNRNKTQKIKQLV